MAEINGINFSGSAKKYHLKESDGWNIDQENCLREIAMATSHGTPSNFSFFFLFHSFFMPNFVRFFFLLTVAIAVNKHLTKLESTLNYHHIAAAFILFSIRFTSFIFLC